MSEEFTAEVGVFLEQENQVHLMCAGEVLKIELLPHHFQGQTWEYGCTRQWDFCSASALENQRK